MASLLPRGLLALSSVLGFALGDLLLRGIPQRRSTADLLNANPTWSAEDSVVLRERRLEPTVAAFPRAGDVCSFLLHRGHVAVEGGLPAADILPPRFDAYRHAPREQLFALPEGDRSFARDARLGNPPWGAETFQVVGMTTSSGTIAVIGRDHDLPASPERSLAFYEDRAGRALAADGRKTALERLRDHEIARRIMLASIWTSILDAAESAKRGDRISAYAVIGDELHVVPRGADPELDEVLADASTIQKRRQDELAALLGDGREGKR